MFRNTLTANRKYSFRDLENLLSPTQIQLSWKLKNCGPFFFFFAISGIYINFLSPTKIQFSCKLKNCGPFFFFFFCHFWNLHQILNYLKKKDDHHSYFITEITGCERLDWTTL